MPTNTGMSEISACGPRAERLQFAVFPEAVPDTGINRMDSK